MTTSLSLRTFMQTSALAIALVLTGCSGGGGSDGGGGGGGTLPPPPPPPPPPPSPAGLFDTSDTTSHFLSKATSGPNQDQIDTLTGTDASDWVRAEFAKPPTLYLPGLLVLAEDEARITDLGMRTVSDAYWNAAIGADDQLRQRMVLALSEIMVVSNAPGSGLSDYAITVGHYMDVLSANAFGNYRDLIQDITYSPGMAVYLTYLRNEKGDMESGSVPDENYAREILQLFSIGLVELNMDGTPRLDGSGQEIPTYDNDDITGLAKVFTGLSFQGDNFYDYSNPALLYSSLEMFDEFHSPLEKTFLGTTIPTNTDGTTSIDTALDTIFNHPNVAPFLSRQLIQRFVTSNPQPAYVQRVATAFESGSYTLPDGTSVGTGDRGDLSATIAAVLLDANATRDPTEVPAEFGKIREPMLRLIHWARAFGVTSPDAADEFFLYDLGSPSLLGQHPFRSPSVFNFFRPGYVSPGSETAASGLVAPELQIFNETSAIGNINVLDAFIFDFTDNESEDPNGGLAPDYAPQIALAETPVELVDQLDLLLTYGSLQDDSRTRIIDTISEIPIVEGFEDETRLQRVYLAIAMVMTTPEYVVQR